jgi:hypothetical protein
MIEDLLIHTGVVLRNRPGAAAGGQLPTNLVAIYTTPCRVSTTSQGMGDKLLGAQAQSQPEFYIYFPPELAIAIGDVVDATDELGMDMGRYRVKDNTSPSVRGHHTRIRCEQVQRGKP